MPPVARPLRLLLTVILLALAALAAGCSNLSGTNGKAYLTGDGQISIYPASERADAVDLHGSTLDGGTWSSKDALGKPVVVNVWWSQCGPCRTEMPMLQAAATELGDTASFVGVNTRDNSAANGIAFERDVEVTYPSIYSPDGKALLALKGLPQAVPSTVVLDARGRLAAVIAGQIDGTRTIPELVECIADATAEDDCKVGG
ncbi:MAG: TlpA disulfide reductase family protein [Nocardioides sp.]|uniref:TlpA disulfide reductase family protein n=1 Tax=Nocardioides sp. TaxID=35761 RepID=UPI0039E31C16